mmetsp:Transcript_39213/g.85499  ORF Transcript_39213/g.85499 Transcript_39213/m.85499 type:complete len:254 (-) Transcript_39213:502-1263(-)
MASTLGIGLLKLHRACEAVHPQRHALTPCTLQLETLTVATGSKARVVVFVWLDGVGKVRARVAWQSLLVRTQNNRRHAKTLFELESILLAHFASLDHICAVDGISIHDRCVQETKRFESHRCHFLERTLRPQNLHDLLQIFHIIAELLMHPRCPTLRQIHCAIFFSATQQPTKPLVQAHSIRIAPYQLGESLVLISEGQFPGRTSGEEDLLLELVSIEDSTTDDGEGVEDVDEGALKQTAGGYATTRSPRVRG